jgi:hypothetical protein
LQPFKPEAKNKESAMKSTLFKSICRLLVISMIFISFQSAQAGMIGTDQIASAHSVQADRATLLNALGRSEVSSQLLSMGVDPSVAKERVAAMTDDEVRTLAGKVGQLPAGGNISGWGWFLIVVIIGVIVYYSFDWKK